MTKQIIHADGIYLNLSEENYHADPALSSSGIKNLIQSPADYWFRSVHNPDREDDSTDAMDKGKLYHRAFFQPETLEQIYAVKPEGMNFATKDGKAWRDEHQAAGKIIASFELWKEITRAVALAKSQGVMDWFGPGWPEVSIFWTHKSGRRMKCRIDWLAQDGRIIDLKTFSNPQRKELGMCLAHTCYYEKYHIQGAWYKTLLESAIENNLKVQDADTTLNLPAAEPQFWFVFQQTGTTPQCVVRHLERYDHANQCVNQYWRAASNEIEFATGIYVKYAAEFGFDRPWLPKIQPKPFGDNEFAPWMIE